MYTLPITWTIWFKPKSTPSCFSSLVDISFQLNCYFQVAYAHPVREQPLYYAGHPPAPVSVPSSAQNTFGVQTSQHQVGYPYYYGSQPSQQQYADPSSRLGHAKVKRAPNSDCMLHDPAETLVVSLHISNCHLAERRCSNSRKNSYAHHFVVKDLGLPIASFKWI